jgi:hypothetical protein
VCWLGAPLIWDGAYQLCLTLLDERPFFYEARFHSYPLWLPVVWLSQAVDNLHALVFLYGLPFCIAPAASLLLSWWIVGRSAPWLIVWPALGIAGITLPGQIFIINDSVFQQHFFWPVFLGLLVPLTWPRAITVIILALFQLSHPVGILLLAIAILSAACLVVFDAGNRRRHVNCAIFASVLGALALTKTLVWPDAYAQKEASLHVLWDRFLTGVWGWPAMGITLMWACAIFVWLHGRDPGHTRDRYFSGLGLKCAPAAAFLTAVLAGSCLLFWATDPHLWSSAPNYRRWVAPFTVPLLAFAVMEVLHRPARVSANGSDRLRSLIVLTCSIAFSAVLSIQALGWQNLTRHLMADVNDFNDWIVPQEAIDWIDATPLDHWSTPSYVLLLQGRRPSKLLLPMDAVSALQAPQPRIALAPWDLRPIAGKANTWFDFTIIAGQLRKNPAFYLAKPRPKN